MTAAEKARMDAGMTTEQAAKKARVCCAYLRRVEQRGNAPYCLALRLAKLYACPINLFL